MGLPIDQAVVFEKGGKVLWSRASPKLKGSPVNALIGDVLLEQRGGTAQAATIDSYAYEWRLVNEKDTLIVVVSQRSLELDFVGDLLDKMGSALVAQLENHAFAREAFDASFDSIEASVEAKLRMVRKKAQPVAAASTVTTEEEEAAAAAAVPVDDEVVSVEERLKNRGIIKKGGARAASGGRKNGAKPPSSQPHESAEASNKKKKATVWQDSKKRLSAKEAASLDYSKSKAPSEDHFVEEMRGASLPAAGEVAAWDEEDELRVDCGDDDDDKNDGGGGGSSGALTEDGRLTKKTTPSWFSRVSGGVLASETTLTADKVGPIMEDLKDLLQSKNVAVEIAQQICDSVAASVVGVKVGRFQRAAPLIRDALKEAITRVLTPRRSTDVLREVLAAKGRRQGPYSIVFVGINGVGKSTTLSKVAYYLKEHGADVQITACDTFRSGAVEQLRTHAKVLDIDLYEKGYLKDPSDVAKLSLDHARAQRRDCVLIDTAGRMQNNDKLMRELAKLVDVNQPDLILFVGEALVGNDGIDQLNMFNSALASHCKNGRCIDGLVLTKFDTIDDKVGATLSMTYKTGQPIMFIGVGQKYTHLKKLSVNAVINSLFS